MKVLILVFTSIVSTTVFASTCEQAAESAAVEKFRNLEYGCYGSARSVQQLDSITMRVTVETIGGAHTCGSKIYDVKFKDSGRGCNVISVTRIGMGGI